MRTWLALPFALVATLSTADAFAGAEHALLAYAFGSTGGPEGSNKTVDLPDLTTALDASFVAPVTGASGESSARVDSTTGLLSVASSWELPPGGPASGTMAPNDWHPAARIEQIVKPKMAGKTGIRVKLDLTITASITGPGGFVHQGGSLTVGACRGSVRATARAVGTPELPTINDVCLAPGYTLTASAGSIVLDVEDIGSGIPIEAEIDVDFESITSGQATASTSGALSMTSTAPVAGKSPSFLSGASAAPPPPAPGGDGTALPPSNGVDAGGGGSAPTPPSSSDDGCNATGAGPAGSAAAVIALWLAGLVVTRRRRN